MKEIPLTQGKVAIVDDDMYDYLMQWKWQYTSAGYAARPAPRVRGKSHRSILMHREIMETPANLEVDHIDGNTLNNSRANLRNCTRAQNMKDRKRRRRNTSGYTGVYVNKMAKKWQAFIRHDDKILYLGLFRDPAEAARIRDAKARELYGEFATENFK